MITVRVLTYKLAFKSGWDAVCFTFFCFDYNHSNLFRPLLKSTIITITENISIFMPSTPPTRTHPNIPTIRQAAIGAPPPAQPPPVHRYHIPAHVDTSADRAATAAAARRGDQISPWPRPRVLSESPSDALSKPRTHGTPAQTALAAPSPDPVIVAPRNADASLAPHASDGLQHPPPAPAPIAPLPPKSTVAGPLYPQRNPTAYSVDGCCIGRRSIPAVESIKDTRP